MSTFYRPVDLYSLSPHQRSHISYPNHYYPNWELVSPQINGGPSRPPMVNESWPCGGGYGYFNPADCHGCCANSYFPVFYGFRHPHSHHLPPTFPHYYHSPYPPYPEVYSSHYVPPPHYSVGQPRYEYDKNIAGSHCCGCPNHKCSSEVDSNVKIEEQEPEVEKAEQKSSGAYQKPAVWIPPGYVKEEDGSLSSKPGPQVWNGWLPFDMSNTKSLKQGGEERKGQDEQNEENRSHFPYPIIWMPGYEKPKEAETKDLKDVSSVTKSPEETPSKQYQHNEEKKGHFPFPFFWMPGYDKRPEPEMKDLKEVSNDTKFAEEVPSKIKTIPVKLLRNDDPGEKPGVADETTGFHAKVAEDELKSKSIPVKQMEDFEENKSSGGTGTAPKSIPVKHMEENANKSSHGSTKSRAGSPKASKLPPVCLRVDPLPRRKNGNGKSRSPSPSGEKGKLQKERDRMNLNSSDMVKESQDLKMQDRGLEKVSEEQSGKNDKNAVEIEKTRNDVPMVIKEVAEIPVREVEIDDKEQQTAKEAVESKTEILEDLSKNKVISAREAAVLIQSAYHGYEVRKWEPLKKLRQVGKVRDQVEEVRERIRALESSPELQMDKKQKLTIGETIMGLLLQLDVIQGLHPSLRDIRKSVARDLVSLQERLDSVASPESEESKLTIDAPMNNAKPVDDNISKTDDMGVPLGQNEEEKPSELSKAPSEEPTLKMEHIGSDVDEVEVGALINEVLAESSARCEEKVLEPPVDDPKPVGNNISETDDMGVPLGQNEEEKPSELSKSPSEEPTSKMEHTCSDADEAEVGALTNEVLADSSAQCEEKVLVPPVEDKEVEKDSERVSMYTAVEPCLVRESIESPEMWSEEAESKAADVEPSIDMEEEEKSNTGPETVVENELECRPQRLDEFPLVGDSAGDQLQEAMDDVIQSSTMQELELPLGVLEETQSSDLEQNVEHVVVERLEFADSDSKPELYNLQPSAMEYLTDEELMKTPNIEDSAHNLQGFEERNQEEKLVEDQVVANVDSSQTVSTLPSDFTDHTIASQAEGMEVIVKESKDDIAETEVPKIDGCTVKEVGNDCLRSIQLEAMEPAGETPNMREMKDGADRLETTTINGVDHNPYGSEMVEGVVISSAAEMEGEITGSDPVAQVSHEQAPPKVQEVIRGGQVPNHSKDLAEDNEKLREMLEKLVEAGKEQLSVISDLNGRIKDLERKLKSKKNMRMRTRKVAAVSSSAKRSNGLGKRNDVTCAA
ncbi:BAG family molecular chaperone regulator 6 [Macadamia integrifolia]|uniref:BAG family molecular chaperone regulator 6 n=1 Tax=Macadamia integrifolia TaxID=60698 RepID=UPI001C4FA860|nr:BAG family molecular chaperone regulator 6 [Macadamia integrifolia]